MKKGVWAVCVVAVFIIAIILARQGSPGIRLREAALSYTEALESGRTGEALAMMTVETANGFSESFLSGLTGTPAPENFVFDGTDNRGIRMAGETGEHGTRIVWLSSDCEIRVVHDTALDNLLGNAVVLCRANALADPQGRCPVSGQPYEYDPATGTVLCPQGHLGEGLVISSDGCSMRRDSVAAELAAFLEAGYPWPASLEDIYNTSSGEFGRRGGYRCPDNGYKYYEIRDGAVYCPFHEEATPVPVTE